MKNPGGKGENSIQILRESFFSIFIDNIPFDRDVNWLRNLFSRDGSTMDVFIPTKGRRASRSRFGFVRYKSSGEAEKAIRRWNGFNVGSSCLEVKLADVGGKPRLPLFQECQDKRSVPGAFFLPRVEATGCNHFKIDEGSRRSCVKEKRSLKLKVVPEHEEWFKKCLVAELKIYTSIENLEKEMRQDGIVFDKVMTMGDGKILIHFLSKEEMEVCLTEDYSSFLKNFSKFQGWKEEEQTRKRTVWLSIFGLPFKAWSEENFELLAAAHGSFVRRDEREFRIIGIERARMLIEANSMGRISETVEAEISGKVYEVSILEDCFLNGCEVDTQMVDSLTCLGDNSMSNQSQKNAPEWGGEACACSNHSVQDCEGKKGSGASSGPSLDLAPEGSSSSSSWASILRSEGVEARKGRLSSVPQRRKVFQKPFGDLGNHSELVAARSQEEEDCWDLYEDDASKGNGIVSDSDWENIKLTDLVGKVRKSSKVVKRKESKVKGIRKQQRRKKKTVLNGIKKSFLEDLEKPLELNSVEEEERKRRKKQRMEAECTYAVANRLEVAYKSTDEVFLPTVDKGLVPTQISSDLGIHAIERERRRVQRKEAEETYHVSLDLGIKGSLPEEEMIQLFENHLQREDRYSKADLFYITKEYL